MPITRNPSAPFREAGTFIDFVNTQDAQRQPGDPYFIPTLSLTTAIDRNNLANGIKGSRKVSLDFWKRVVAGTNQMLKTKYTVFDLFPEFFGSEPRPHQCVTIDGSYRLTPPRGTIAVHVSADKRVRYTYHNTSPASSLIGFWLRPNHVLELTAAIAPSPTLWAAERTGVQIAWIVLDAPEPPYARSA